MINDAVRDALAERLLGMADDELVFGPPQLEWAGHGPILEEDIVLPTSPWTRLGHAAIWYGLRGELTGEDADRLIFFSQSRPISQHPAR